MTELMQPLEEPVGARDRVAFADQHAVHVINHARVGPRVIRGRDVAVTPTEPRAGPHARLPNDEALEVPPPCQPTEPQSARGAAQRLIARQAAPLSHLPPTARAASAVGS